MIGQTLSLFQSKHFDLPKREEISSRAFILRGKISNDECCEILKGVRSVINQSPFRTMTTRGGQKFSVSMTNCGEYGWVSDHKGYRYEALDPLTQNAWPPMPPLFYDLAISAARAAGFPHFTPECCLINCYKPGAKMGLHQDKDEIDKASPIVSLSLGLSAIFQFGGLSRTNPIKRFLLNHGDIVIWGGRSRLCYHGILPIKRSNHFDLELPAITREARINLTFRKVT